MSHQLHISHAHGFRGDDLRLWEEHGRRMVDALLTEAGMPTGLDWKVVAKACHKRSGPKPPYRMKFLDKSMRRIEIQITPPVGSVMYDVSFSFSGEGIGWEDSCQKFEVAMNRLRLPKRQGEQLKQPKVSEATFTVEQITRLRDGLDGLLKVTSSQRESQQRLDKEKAQQADLRRQHDIQMEVVLGIIAESKAEQEAFEVAQAEHTRRAAEFGDRLKDQNGRLARIEEDLELTALEIEAIECTLRDTIQIGATPEVMALLKGLAGSAPA